MASGVRVVRATGTVFVMPDLADDDPLLTLEGTDYVYTLHAVWRAGRG